jgi:hypothetical protein
MQFFAISTAPLKTCSCITKAQRDATASCSASRNTAAHTLKLDFCSHLILRDKNPDFHIDLMFCAIKTVYFCSVPVEISFV